MRLIGGMEEERRARMTRLIGLLDEEQQQRLLSAVSDLHAAAIRLREQDEAAVERAHG
jgi:hypothetical protein